MTPARHHQAFRKRRRPATKYSLQGTVQEHLQFGLGYVLDDEALVRGLAESRAALASLSVPFGGHAQAPDVAVAHAEHVVRVGRHAGRDKKDRIVPFNAPGAR